MAAGAGFRDHRQGRPLQGRHRPWPSGEAGRGRARPIRRQQQATRCGMPSACRPCACGSPSETCRLTFVRAAHFPQYGLDPAPSLRLLLVASLRKRRGLLSGLCDGFGALCFKKVACNCRNICCIHLWAPPKRPWQMLLDCATAGFDSNQKASRYHLEQTPRKCGGCECC